MKRLQKSLLLFLLSIVFFFLLAGCGSAENSPNSGDALSAGAIDPGVTTIVIDGEGDDWDNRPLLSEDPIGDAEGDFLDIGKVYAFLNQDSLYILIELANPGADFEQFDFEISADGQHQLFTWHKSFDNFGKIGNSEFAAGSVVEGKIDLDDIGSPEGNVVISQIRVMAGDPPPSETWRAVDEIGLKLQYLVWVDEVDFEEQSGTTSQDTPPEEPNPQNTEPPAQEPPEPAEHVFLFDEPLEERAKYVWLEERGEYADYLYRQFHQNAQEASWGPDGYLYIADGIGKHIVKMAPDGTMEDLEIWKTHIYMQEYGPNAITFDLEGNLIFNTGPHVYKRTPGGTIEYMFTSEYGEIRSLTMDKNGVLFYSNASNPILQWNPNGTDKFLTNDYRDPQIVTGQDGQLYISDYGKNRVIVFDVNTREARIFAEGYFGSEACYMRIDQDGDLWVRSSDGGVHQFSPEGELKPITINGLPEDQFRWHLAGEFVFDPEGNIWFPSASGDIFRLTPVDPNQSDPDAFTSEYIYHSFEASDIAVGPDGSIYATNLVPGNIWRFNPDGSYEIIWEHGDQGRVGIAIMDDNVIYAGTIFGEILKMENNQISHYANLYTERMVIGGDGYLYAVEGRWGEEQKIVRIPAPDTIEVVSSEIDGVPLGTNPLQIAPAQDNGLYVVNQSYGILYYMDFSGEGYELKDFGAEMQYTIIGSSPTNGKLYLLAHLTVDHNTILNRYTLYEYAPGGELSVVAPAIPGDPWGMDVSPDGKWLYVIEVGAIDKIPLDYVP